MTSRDKGDFLLQWLRESALPGALAGIATSVAATLLSRAQVGRAPAALNAVSHILWGRDAARQDGFSARHTLAGLLLNQGATAWWGTVFRGVAGRSPAPGRALAGGAAVAALAYLVDYHLIPRRFTPGYELRLDGRALAGIFGALAAGLAAGGMLAARRTPPARR
jgi:hypothetical protein